MTDKNPKKIQNDFPDGERRVEQRKSQNDDSATDDAAIKREEAAVEKAIEELPAD